MQELPSQSERIAAEVFEQIPEASEQAVRDFLRKNYALDDDGVDDVFDEFEDLQLESQFRNANEYVPYQPPENPMQKPTTMMEKKALRKLLRDLMKKNPQPSKRWKPLRARMDYLEPMWTPLWRLPRKI